MKHVIFWNLGLIQNWNKNIIPFLLGKRKQSPISNNGRYVSLKFVYPRNSQIHASGFSPHVSRLAKMDNCLKNCLMLQYQGAVGSSARWQSKWLSAASAKFSPSANLCLSKMSTEHTVIQCRYLSTNPKAIYSKLYWIQFKVLLAQHQSTALGITQSHVCRTAHLGSQNCWWIVQVNYQEIEKDSQKMHATYLGLIYKAYKVFIRFFYRIPKFQQNIVLVLMWYQIGKYRATYLGLWFDLFLYSLSFHILTPLSHSFLNKCYIIDGSFILYTL